MLKRLLCIFIFLLLFVNGFSAKEKITVGGTGACQNLVKKLAKAFMLDNDGIVEVPDSIGSGGGIKMAGKGVIEIGRVARKITDKEKKYKLKYKEFALSPIVFGTKSDVGVKNLSSSDVCKIFSGKIKNWKELGGKDLPIYVIGREKGDSSLSEIRKYLKGFNKVSFPENIIIALKDLEMIEKVEGKDGAIGFGTLSNFSNAKLKLFSIDGISPTIENVQRGKYKIFSTFAFVYKKLSGLSKSFMDFVFSDKGKKIINENFCVEK